MVTSSGTKLLFEHEESTSFYLCAPEVLVITSSVFENMLTEEENFLYRSSEMIVDLHEEDFSLRETSSVFEPLRNCGKRLMKVVLIKSALL